jgi:YidC/Oxa1 family membrane protein insertase
MAQTKHPILRVAVPLIVLVGGVGVAIAVAINAGVRQGSATAPPSTQAASSSPAASPPDTKPPTDAQPVPTMTGLRARVFDGPSGGFESLGSLTDPAQSALIEFSPVGAGVRSITLAGHFESIERKPDQHVVIQREHPGNFVQLSRRPDGKPVLDAQGRPLVVASYRTVATPLAATAVEINGSTVDLSGLSSGSGPSAPEHFWRQTSPGAFEAEIVDGDGAVVARVTRVYTLTPGTYSISLTQKVENLTRAPMSVRWWQFGPVDLPAGNTSYGGDKRRVRFGYLASPQADPAGQYVLTGQYETLARASVLGARDSGGYYKAGETAWPNPASSKHGLSLVWLGMTNRYFGVALHPAASGGATGKVFHQGEKVYSVVLDPAAADPVLALQTCSEAFTAAPGAVVDLSLGVYAGPLARREIARAPGGGTFGLPGLVVYNFGGPCGWCTFTSVTGLLLGLLHFLHDYVLHDWALSIIFLVVVVRTILHPVTKWSQIRMARFGKQMQGMAPKQKKIQEKYKDDPKKQREEMARLWREEGVSPTGALGCLPMFLQTPVWIALYAMLYFAFELRHQPAFFGLVQAVRPGHPGFLGWFLGDLSEPDRFWYFGRTLFTVPLLGVPFDSVNILPIVLGIVFYIQQKYLTPPSTAPMTPEQEQTQKMMKVMMVVLFPVMMYGAPSGLAVYFICNSTLGILESKYIRSHIDKHDLLKPRERKIGSGFLARLQAAAAERQRQLEKARQQRGKSRR